MSASLNLRTKLSLSCSRTWHTQDHRFVWEAEFIYFNYPILPCSVRSPSLCKIAVSILRVELPDLLWLFFTPSNHLTISLMPWIWMRKMKEWKIKCFALIHQECDKVIRRILAQSDLQIKLLKKQKQQPDGAFEETHKRSLLTLAMVSGDTSSSGTQSLVVFFPGIYK